MAEVDTHLQCQVCQLTFQTNKSLRDHLKKFEDLTNRIRAWDEQCRAHLEPLIDLAGTDDLDTELCGDHPALFKARVCPVEGCKKEFNEKKQLNIHFESHDECTEICIVCHTRFSHTSKFMAHTIHAEAIKRHRSYIKTTRDELRRGAREKLHRMLIEASNREKAAKRRPEEVDLDQQQPTKRTRVLERDNNNPDFTSEIGVYAESRESLPVRDQFVSPIYFPDELAGHNADPNAAPLYFSGGLAGHNVDPNAAPLYFLGGLATQDTDPYAPPLYRYLNVVQSGEGNGYTLLPQQVDGAMSFHSQRSEDIRVPNS